MNKIAIAILSLSLLLFAGCGTQHNTGTEGLKGTSVSEIEKKLVIGSTTKQDIERELGTPSGINKKDGKDTWKYHLMSSQTKVRGESFIPIIGGLVGGTDHKMENRILELTFNKNGVLESYNFDTMDSSDRF